MDCPKCSDEAVGVDLSYDKIRVVVEDCFRKESKDPYEL